ncbi:MAG: SDR family oxidoreductase [Actinomycetota bacterium]
MTSTGRPDEADAARLDAPDRADEMADEMADDIAETDLAVVGMSGRFPGAPDVDRLWQRVVSADDCLVDLDPDLLVEAGVPAAVVDHREYVTRAGVLDGVDQFDPEFFGIGPRDAAIMDPQHRHLLECAWEALEGAAIVPERFDGAIGVFAGCGMNTYLVNNLMTTDLVDRIGWFLLRHTGNDKDFLPTFISYKLDLHGPSIGVQTACSTSLVAIHLAAQSLLSFECDLALAGGATIEVPHGVGYTYRDGEILSPDGRCRAYDERSGGTVLTSGAGILAIRRLTDALQDGDPVLAVIKGTAVNNDGSRKVGFLAPSVDGHADAVQEALAVSGLSARDIELVDGHGTGTAVGDPIEFTALTEAFRASTDETGFCRLTSTKPNIGHLDTAAGVASAIKVVQALRHQVLPPLANHTGPSELLDVDRSPFVLSGDASPWPSDGPRRAGVSSLGVGGTNAHAIFEQAPDERAGAPGSPEQVLALSAVNPVALDALQSDLADHLEREPGLELADVAHTLATGRRVHAHRRIVTVTDTRSAPVQLRDLDRRRSFTSAADEHPSRLVFLFPGGGAQYPTMAQGLDARFEVFHDTLGAVIRSVRESDGPDLEPLLRGPHPDPDQLRRADVSLPAVFATSVALARQWEAWGARPDALLGHSLGEYVAAHLAGVVDLHDATGLVVTRSRLMTEAGAAVEQGVGMLSVGLAEKECVDRLPSGLAIAVVNTTEDCVVAGPHDLIESFAAQLEVDGVSAHPLRLDAAAHSPILDPVLDRFHDAVRAVRLTAPATPYPSNLTGDWISPEQATDPQYWVDHLRGTVRFADCLTTVGTGGRWVGVELGPGHALSSAARHHESGPHAAIAALRHPNDSIDDTVHSIGAFGAMWAAGVPCPPTPPLGAGRVRRRLPTYPFQRTRHWIDPGDATVRPVVTGVTTGSAAAPSISRIPDSADWFWEPIWITGAPVDRTTGRRTDAIWLVDGATSTGRLTAAVTDELRRRGLTVVEWPDGDAGALRDADALCDADALRDADDVVLLLIGRDGPDHDLDAAIDRWSTRAVDRIADLSLAHERVSLAAITIGASDAFGPALRPADALVAGPVLVAPQEFAGTASTWIDLEPDTVGRIPAIVDELLAETPRVALDADSRMVPELVRRRVDDPHTLADVGAGVDGSRFVPGGVYLVTGGLGDVGFAFAHHLAVTHGVRLAVTSSSPLPPDDEWDAWIARHGSADPTSRRIIRVRDLRAAGADVEVLVADVADPVAVRHAVDRTVERFGSVDGAIHAAGALDDQLIALSDPETRAAVIRPKATAALELAAALDTVGGHLLLLVSSTSTTIGTEGQVAYVAANAVLDASVGRRGRVRVVTLNSGAWAGIGLAADAARALRLGLVDGDPIDHPVLASRHALPGEDGAVRIAGRLDARHDWVAGEHRTATGTSLLPATGHLELMLAACAAAGIERPTLSDVLFIDPLVVPDDRIVSVSVTVRPDGDRRWNLEVESDDGLSRGWRTHSQAVASVDPSDADGHDLGDGDSGSSGAAALFGGDDLAAGFDPMSTQRASLRVGPRWSADQLGMVAGEVARARLSLPSDLEGDTDHWHAHPALVDLAVGLGAALRPADLDGLLVPVSLDALRWHRRLPGTVDARARAVERTDRRVVVDITIMAVDGEPLADLDHLVLRRLEPGASLRSGPVPRTSRSRVPAGASRFVALAEGAGLRADDAGDLLERVLYDGAERLIVSTVDLESLRDRRADDDPDADDDQAPPPAPAGGLTGALQRMWSDLLDVAVDTDDDFFELGGHSLIAIRMIARINRELGVRLALDELLEAPTIDQLTTVLRTADPEVDDRIAVDDVQGSGDADDADETGTTTDTTGATGARSDAPTRRAPRTLVRLNTTGDGTPFTVVHGAGGNVMFLSPLARLMRNRRPLVGVQAIGIDGRDEPDPTIEAMAERYVEALAARTDGPHLLGGFSGGGLIALDMGRRLQQLGHEVRGVVLFDSVPPGAMSLPRWSSRWNVIRHVATAGPRATMPYLKNRFGGRLLKLLGPQLEHGAEPVPPELRDQVEEGVRDLYDHFTEVALLHRPSVVEFDVAVIKADLMWPYQPEDYHWSEYVAGSLDVVTTPGDHESMFRHPDVTDLWARIGPILDRWDDQPHDQPHDSHDRAT